MPITLNGTTGIQNVLGSASAPAESNTTSSNTGLYFPTSTTLGLSTNGAAALTIDASQNVGIGTASPSALLHVSNASAKIRIGLDASSQYTDIYRDGATGFTVYNAAQAAPFRSHIWQLGGSEAMRIDSSGNVGIGTTTPSTKLHVVGEVTATQGVGGYPAFNAYASAAQTVTSATVTKIAINTENFDTNNNFDTTNNRFTPTVEGYYQVNGTVLGTGATTITALLVFIYKNGVNIRRTGLVASLSAGNNSQVSVSEVIYMNGTTDYIELYGQVNGTGTLQFAFSSSVTTSSFSACLVRGA